MPPLLTALVDDAAVFPPGNAALADAIPAHAHHRDSWFAPLIGPLLIPVADLPDYRDLSDQRQPEHGRPEHGRPEHGRPEHGRPEHGRPEHGAVERRPAAGIGVIGEPAAVERAIAELPAGTRQIESPVAKRGEDPLPGIKRLAALCRTSEQPQQPQTHEPKEAHELKEPREARELKERRESGERKESGERRESGERKEAEEAEESIAWYCEVPLAWGLMSALDELADLRAEGLPMAAKFRTGGLAAELFPTPVELAAVICACRDRELPFKLTAGLHHAVRHTDAETGLVHHGFLNVLVAVLAAADGGEPADLAGILAGTDALPLAEQAHQALERPRPLWVGFGSCSVTDPVADLTVLGLLTKPKEA